MINRHQIIAEMRKNKKSYSEIAKKLCISKQRVHQIYKHYFPTPKDVILPIKKRDNFACVICGDFQFLEVHHINGIKRDNKKENLVTLCRKCHRRIESIDRKSIKTSEHGWGDNGYPKSLRIKARKLYKRGLSIKDIAKKLSVSRDFVMDHTSRRKLPVDNSTLDTRQA